MTTKGYNWLAGLAAVFALSVFGGSARAATTWYVDVNVPGGTYSGTSWTNAFVNVTNALAVAGMTDQVWVAQGVYKPGTTRDATFRLATNGLALYGGFTNGMGTLGERNWTSYVTMLSGDVSNTPVDMNDNCTNVVKITAANNTVIDGFTIAYGGATNASSSVSGGGIRMYSVNATIANCTIISNRSFYGGGLYVYNASAATLVTNCLFLDNIVTNVNCYGGGIYHNLGSPRIVNCTFRGNIANEPTLFYTCGGGIALNVGGSPLISNCNFYGNSACQYGGGVSVIGLAGNVMSPRIVRCTFSGNLASSASFGIGGALCVVDFGVANVENCMFSRNTAGRRGGGIAVYTNGVLAASNCAFIGNDVQGNRGGGGLYQEWGSTAQVVNCSFIGNRQTSASTYGGGGILIAGGGAGQTATVINCTFYRNTAASIGGAIALFSGSKLSMTNCIVWSNFPYNVHVENSTATVAYTTIEGGTNAITNVNSLVVDGGGNLNSYPQFADIVTGRWTAAGSYNTNFDQSILTSSNAVWTPNEHAGKAVWVNTNTSYAYYYVVTNTATNLTTQGRADLLGTNTAAYWIIDVHEKSRGGRYTPVGWVADPVHSPCIDAGDPNVPYALEPWPNGRRLNMGCYGNTPEASMSYVPRGSIFGLR